LNGEKFHGRSLNTANTGFQQHRHQNTCSPEDLLFYNSKSIRQQNTKSCTAESLSTLAAIKFSQFMIPAFLEEYKLEIEKFKLETIKITAAPKINQLPLLLKQSKFLGTPFFPKSIEYPKNKHGKPLIMWAQLNFEEIPPLKNFPQKGILQFFLSPVFWDDIREGDFRVFYHEHLDQEVITDFSFLEPGLYEDCPINVEHSLSFKKEVEYGSTEDIRFTPNFRGKTFYEFADTLTSDEKEELTKAFYICGHKLGGYAYFTQTDPRDYDKNIRDHLLLLQIDTDENIMFGDAGVCNFFISEKDLKNRNFTNVHFNWDCC